jgi:hypothetical protein
MELAKCCPSFMLAGVPSDFVGIPYIAVYNTSIMSKMPNSRSVWRNSCRIVSGLAFMSKRTIENNKLASSPFRRPISDRLVAQCRYLALGRGSFRPCSPWSTEPSPDAASARRRRQTADRPYILILDGFLVHRYPFDGVDR